MVFQSNIWASKYEELKQNHATAELLPRKWDLHAIMAEIVHAVSVGQQLVAEHQSLTTKHCIFAC